MTDAPRVVIEVAEGVLTATLNRPEKKNAIDTPMIEGIEDLRDKVRALTRETKTQGGE